MKIQRHLPPTAAPVMLGDLLRASVGFIRGKSCLARFEQELKQYFGVKHVFLFTSGKAALATLIRALSSQSSRRKVVIPAYTCYTVPSAVIRGGGQVILCDVDPRTLDFVHEDLKRVVDRDTLCIVTPHLLGHAADVSRVKAIAEPFGVTVIEDAAQAMGGQQGGRFLGTMGDAGFFSLGRGKNLSAGSGGVLVTDSDTVAAAVEAACREIPDPPLMHRWLNVAIMAAMQLLITPRLYWLPAGLPFLKLGETHFDPDFPIQKLDGMRAGLLTTWRRRLAQSNEERRARSRGYLATFSPDIRSLAPRGSDGTLYLRFPLLLPHPEQKAALCAIGQSRGLGISGLYPRALSEIPELRSTVGSQRFLGAETLAGRLVTLPVHRYVGERDLLAVQQAIHEVLHPHPSSAVHREAAGGDDPSSAPMARQQRQAVQIVAASPGQIAS